MKLSDKPDVLIMGHPMLFAEQRQISLNELQEEDFIHNLKILRQAQIDNNGIGIAAPQIGWPVRVLCMGISDANRRRYPQAPQIPFSFWLNPEVTDFSKKTCWAWEGCLSIPGIKAWIERPETVCVSGYNEQGERIEAEMSGFAGRVMQHELDHLSGKLFPMRVEDKNLFIPSDAMGHQSNWAENWPTANARATPGGQISRSR